MVATTCISAFPTQQKMKMAAPTGVTPMVYTLYSVVFIWAIRNGCNKSVDTNDEPYHRFKKNLSEEIFLPFLIISVKKKFASKHLFLVPKPPKMPTKN